MPSKIINTLITNDKSFSINFKIDNYDKGVLSSAILNIWQEIKISLQQEEKINDHFYFYHKIKRSDSIESLANDYFGSVDFWWLILVSNDIIDPFDFLDNSLYEGDTIKIIKQDFLKSILKNNTSVDITEFLKGI